MWGALLDYISPKILLAINIIFMIALAATFDVIASSKPLFMLWMIMLYIQYGGLYAFFPILALKVL